MVNEDWSMLSDDMSPTELLDSFEKHSSYLISNTFPEKEVTVSNYDKPYMTEESRNIRRQRQRVYRKHGRNDKYLELKHRFDDELKIEAEKYRIKIENEVTEWKRNNCYAA